MSYVIEVCVDSLESALAAEAGGADRIELCSALAEGGITPSHGLLTAVCRRLSTCKVHVLIRPRPGDFLYSPEEVEVMRQDVFHVAAAGAAGVVCGFLTPGGEVDVDLTRLFADLCSAAGLDMTFHRAFDAVRDQRAALAALIGCGVRKVLSSGGHPTALQGAEQLASLASEADGRISVMPGGGITEENVADVAAVTGCTELHGTFKRMVGSGMRFIHPRVTFSSSSSALAPSNGQEEGDRAAAWGRWVADGEAVARVRGRLAELTGDRMGAEQS